MPRKNDSITTAGIMEDELNAGTLPVNRGSPLNQRPKRDNKRPDDMGLHGQPYGLGRKDSAKRK
jgi:hypothetical protein